MITSLFWVRRKKLQQIADRWFILQRLAERIVGKDGAGLLLESLVCQQLTGRRYVEKDFFLNYALSSPIYALLLVHTPGFWSDGPIAASFAVAVIIVHAVLSGLLLGRPFRAPVEP